MTIKSKVARKQINIWFIFNDSDGQVDVEVVRGFMSNNENKRKFDVVSDKRYNTHNLGTAMQLRIRNPTEQQSNLR